MFEKCNKIRTHKKTHIAQFVLERFSNRKKTLRKCRYIWQYRVGRWRICLKKTILLCLKYEKLTRATCCFGLVLEEMHGCFDHGLFWGCFYTSFGVHAAYGLSNIVNSKLTKSCNLQTIKKYLNCTNGNNHHFYSVILWLDQIEKKNLVLNRFLFYLEWNWCSPMS